MVATAPNRNRLIGAVASTLRVLEVLVEASGPTSLSDIACQSGHPKSSVHRMLSSLKETGYVEQNEAGLYQLTFKILRMGMELLSSTGIVRASRLHLERLVQATNENAYLSVIDANNHTVYLAKVESLSVVQVNARLGIPIPAWKTATGWAMLAFMPDARKAVLSETLSAHIPSAITDPILLGSALEEVACRGYAVTIAQGNADTGGIAAPIYDGSGTVIAACSVAIPLYRMDDKLVRKCVPLVVQAASSISTEMGLVQAHRERL